MRAQDKVVVITGSTKGIGRIAAMIFAREGASVIVTGRSADAGRSAVKEIEDAGGTAAFVPADLGSEQECKALIDGAVAAFGRVDILVNNAAPIDFVSSGGEQSIVDQTEENLDYIFRVGVYAPIWCCKYAIPVMRRAGGGSIVMVSSVASLQGLPKTPTYSASKGAINALTRQIAVEFAPDNIRCNCIVIGYVPVGTMLEAHAIVGDLWDNAVLTRRGRPEDVANAMLYLSGAGSEYLTGVLLPVDGGITAKSVLPSMDEVVGALGQG